MGSIPVRSTKKHRMQFCIRCFLVLLLVNLSSVHNSEAVQQQQRKAEKHGVYYKPAYYPKIRQKQTCVLSVNRGKIISRFIGSRDILTHFILHSRFVLNLPPHAGLKHIYFKRKTPKYAPRFIIKRGAAYVYCYFLKQFFFLFVKFLFGNNSLIFQFVVFHKQSDFFVFA